MGSETRTEALAIANRHVARSFCVEDGKFRSIAIEDRRTGVQLPLDSEEFRIVFMDGGELSGADFVHREHAATETPDGGRTLNVRLEQPDQGIQAEIVYSLGADDFYVRKRVALFADRSPEQPIDRFDVESFTAPGALDCAVEYQPVFLDGRFFAGLEYPAAVNGADGGRVRLSHFPGVTLGPERWESKSAVFGTAVTGDLFRDFLTYVDRVRRKNQLCNIWNSGGDLQVYDPVQLPKLATGFSNFLYATVTELQRELTVKRGALVDFYTLDAGWQDPDTLYEVDVRKFPQALRTYADQVQSTPGARVGLWLSSTTPLSPTLLKREVMERCGYACAVYPARSVGYPCLSHPPYFAAIKEVMRRHVEELNVGFYKMDFEYFECEGEGHGHLPTVRHGREANVDALLELMTMLAAVRPDIRLRPTSGMWLSPWWLLVSDVIWAQGMMDFNYSRGPVTTSPREWELTLRDQEFHRLLRVESPRFPFSGLLYMGMGAGPRYNIAGPHESRESYLNAVVYCNARQLKCPERQVGAPPSHAQEDWAALAATVLWGKDRHERVPDGEMILGEPRQGEVYGFSNLGPEGGVVTLRNPGMSMAETNVPLDGLDADTEFLVEIVSPYRRCLGSGCREALTSRLAVGLAPQQAVVIEATPVRDLARPVLRGVRYAIVAEKPGEMVVDVFSEAGAARTVELAGPIEVASCAVAGAAVELCHNSFDVPAKGSAQRLALLKLPERPASSGDMSMQMTRLDIPDAHQATLRILTNDEKPHPLRISVNMGGWFGGLPYCVCKGEGWTAYDVELNPRDMNVIAWGFPNDDAPAAAEMWLLRSWDLEKTRVTLTFEPPADRESRPELPTPFAGVVRHSLCVTDVLQRQSGAGDDLPWTDEYAETAETAR